MGASCTTIEENSVQSQYSIKNRLGVGSFSVVKRGVRLSDGKEVAIKIVDKRSLPPNELKMMVQEAEILKMTDHPQIVKLIDVFETESKLYIVIQLLKGGGLFRRVVSLGYFSEQKASSIVKNIAQALRYIHSKGIVHRDLKPENLIFQTKNDNSIKLTDFGLAKRFDEEQEMVTICGSPSYIAPEVLNGSPYDQSVDLWSLGVILYTLLCGFPPFYGQNAKRLFECIRTGKFEYPDAYWEYISDEAKDLVNHLLVVDAKERYTPVDVLEHPFITNAHKMSDEPFDEEYTDRLVQFGEFWRATWEFLTRAPSRRHMLN